MIKVAGAIFGAVVLMLAGLLSYGYLVDMAPAPQPQTQGVVLNAQ